VRTYIGHQEAVTPGEFVELAGGFDLDFSDELQDLFFSEDAADDFRDLFLGSPGETEAQRTSRELLAAGCDDEIERVNAAYAAQLVCVAKLRKQATSPRMHRMQKAA
jgi:hypothetical protein